MDLEEQLDKWVEGESIHNKELGNCVPDFSCCRPALATKLEVRQKFKAADGIERMRMCGQFYADLVKLDASKKYPDAKVVIKVK